MRIKAKLKISIIVYEEDDKQTINYQIEENNAAMKDIALAVYKLKQIEQELIDRDYDGEGYEVTEND